MRGLASAATETTRARGTSQAVITAVAVFTALALFVSACATGGTAEDVVVNVLTCGDGVGVGSYVYREQNGSYENVFQAEEPPVYAQIDRGDLVVSKQVYEKGDPVSNPSGENVITYRWNGSRFAQEYFWHNDYGTVVEDTPSPVPEA